MGVGVGRGVAVGGGNGVAVGCGVRVGVGVSVGAGDGGGVAVVSGVGFGEGTETGAGVGGGTGTWVEEAGPFTDSDPEAAAGWGVDAGSSTAAGTAESEDARVGGGDAVNGRAGIAAAVGATVDEGEMSGRINNPAKVPDDPGWTEAGVGEGMTGAVGGTGVMMGNVGVGMGVNPGAETGDAQAVADPNTTNQQTKVMVSP